MNDFLSSSLNYGDTVDSNYKGIDGIFVLGDITQGGGETQFQKFFEVIDSYERDGTIIKTVLGNHDFYNGLTGDDKYSEEATATSIANYLKYSGYEGINDHIVINGCHYIFISNDMYSSADDEYFTDATLAWIKEQLVIAADADPTGKKPIFVFQHEPPDNDTVSGFGGGDADLTKIFKKYPQIINFSGHTHKPITDAQSIWQDGFTALNTGSLSYLGITLFGNVDGYGSVNATDPYGSWTTRTIEESERNGRMFYIIEVAKDNRVRVLNYNMLTDSINGEAKIIEVGDTSKFTYTNDRKEVSVAPKFDDGAMITLVSNSYAYTVLSFPQANGIDGAQNYRIEVSANGEVVKNVYRIAGLHYGDAKSLSLLAPIPKLQASTEYTVKIYPVNVWSKVGEPLEITFTTSSAEVVPDVLSIQFNTDGTAINKETGEALGMEGTVTTAYDEILGTNVAKFDGSSGYSFEKIEDWYHALAYGFTMEAYVKITCTTSDTVCIAANQEASCGFGITLTKDAKTLRYIHYREKGGDSYQNVQAEYKSDTSMVGEWMHLVVVFDGSYSRMYINGVQVAYKSAQSGVLRLPVETGRTFWIGGDSSATGGFSAGAKVDMTAFNIYARGLTAAQVAERYATFNTKTTE